MTERTICHILDKVLHLESLESRIISLENKNLQLEEKNAELEKFLGEFYDLKVKFEDFKQFIKGKMVEIFGEDEDQIMEMDGNVSGNTYDSIKFQDLEDQNISSEAESPPIKENIVKIEDSPESPQTTPIKILTLTSAEKSKKVEERLDLPVIEVKPSTFNRTLMDQNGFKIDKIDKMAKIDIKREVEMENISSETESSPNKENFVKIEESLESTQKIPIKILTSKSSEKSIKEERLDTPVMPILVLSEVKTPAFNRTLKDQNGLKMAKFDIKREVVIEKEDEKIQNFHPCPQNFSRSSAHMKIYSKKPEFKCTTCPKNFLDPETLHKHMENHFDKIEEIFEKDEDQIDGSSSNSIESIELEDQNISSKTESLQNKENFVNIVDSLKLIQQSPIKILNPNSAVDKTHVCPEPDCKLLKFKTKSQLSAHKVIHRNVKTKKLHKCQICKKEFSLKYNLKIHNRSHTGETPYKCQICKKEFSLKCNLKTHNRSHTGETPYKCQICKKEFSLKSTLKTHNRSHTGETPYKCQICKKEFSLKCNLKTHNRSHTGETPYKCQICKKEFSLKCNLKTHNRSHTGETPYKCQICKKEFSLKCNLKTHNRSHTGEKPYNCSICKKSLTNRSSLTHHYKTQHKTPLAF